MNMNEKSDSWQRETPGFPARDEVRSEAMVTGLEIAVIGMAGRFPGAKRIDEFWDNLKNGVETISFFSDMELEAAGIGPDLTGNLDYVKAKGFLADIEYFDHYFFNYTRREGEIMDPQMRFLHECAWEALEHSGYDPMAYKGPIGLYGGASSGFNWEAAMILSGKIRDFGLGAAPLTRKDMACLRVSYRLNLKGPVFSLYTTCSTSLAAIHLACQGLLSGECDMALAGGVTVSLPQVNGYFYQEGMIYSRDGHCRAFDAGATGTIGGNGAALVVLKRLEDAAAARDYVYAVIKGSAMNNDGNRKVGFTAPSIKGQVEVLRAAYKMAGVNPETIGYIETHGTGTTLGDPIEIKALIQAFDTNKRRFCGIGSVKTNVGHLDAAAGVTGFIKTVLALKHRFIPPSLNFKTPNPDLQIENSPFYVNSELLEWKNNQYPLRAGVSSFGIGGTNVHVVLEEWSETRGREALAGEGPVAASYRLIVLSAKTPSALERMTGNLARYFKDNPGINLADAAYTLSVGRKTFPYKRMLVCSTVPQAMDLLSSPSNRPETVQTFFAKEENRPVVFMFPGQGAQYVDMGVEIYQGEPGFREEMDRCFKLLKPLLGYDLKEILYPGIRPDRSDLSGLSDSSARSNLNQTEITQPILFIFEYALAKLLMAWGIKPLAMIGHSIGEYVAACLAGVFSLEDALKIVVLRGKSMQQMPTGAMLSVSLQEDQLRPLIALNNDVSLAAVNSPSHCVVSGPHEAITDLAARLKEKGIESKPLHTSHAFHSKMMEPILKTFADNLKQIKLNKPEIPFISNLTGEIITAHQAADPGYWANQLRQTVRFSRGIARLLKEENVVFLEVGPGRTLSTFVKQHRRDGKKEGQAIVNLTRHPREKVSDIYCLLGKLGELWSYGVNLDMQAVYTNRPGYRIPLPTYSFDGIRCGFGEDLLGSGKITLSGQPQRFEKKEMTEWFYVPSWERSPLTRTLAALASNSPWLVFLDACGFGGRLVEELKKQGKEVVTVQRGETFTGIPGNRYNINPQQGPHYDMLFESLMELGKIPAVIIHLWGITPARRGRLKADSVKKALDEGFSSLIHTAQAVARQKITGRIRIGVVTNNLQEVTGEEVLRPEKATVLAPVKIIPLEYPNLTCQSLDIVLPPPGSRQEDLLVGHLEREFTLGSQELFVAYRGMHRWTQTFKRVCLDKTPDGEANSCLKEGSVFLVTGGAGDTATATAGYLSAQLKARVILILPPGYPPEESRHQLRHRDEAGGPVMIENVEGTDKQKMKRVAAKVKKRFGQVNGLIYIPGNAPETGAIQEMSPGMSSAFVAASLERILIVDGVLKDLDLEPDFTILFSSIGTAVYASQVGTLVQCAANDFLDAFSYYKTSRDNTFASTINHWLTPREINVEWIDFLNRILENRLPRVLVSPLDLENLIRHYDEYEAWLRRQTADEDRRDKEAEEDTRGRQREGLGTPHTPPATPTEKILVGMWQRFFGIAAIGIRDDFFRLGGDSLQAMTIANTLQQTLQVKIPMDFFFAQPTIQKLAQYIDHQARTDSVSPLQPVEKKEYYPLSPMQETILIVHRMNPESVTYNISLSFPLEAKIDRTILTRTFARLIERHESFRTSFHMPEGKFRQKIHDPGTVDFAIESHGSRENGHGSGTILNDFVRPFSLSRPPLLRVGLVGQGEGKHLIMIDMHHIVSDGNSGRIMIKELLARPGELPGLRIQYKDYAHWYNNELHAGLLKKQEAYWLKQFETEIPILDLPLDYERPAKRNFQGNLVAVEMAEEKVEKLNRLIREENTTAAVVVLSIFNIFLAKLTGLEDITVVTAVDGRNHQDLTNVIGMFVKTLFYRNYPRKEKGFREFLGEVRTRMLEAYENQDYQPDTLVDKVAAHRDPRRSPITDVAFVQLPAEKKRDAATVATPGGGASGIGREDVFVVDLALLLVERGNRPELRFAYLTELFKKETIERYTKYFYHLLNMVLDNREIPLGDLRLTDEMLEATSEVDEIDFDL